MFKKLCCNKDAGLLVVRIALAIIFIVHGWLKVADLESAAYFFNSVGLPEVLGYVVAFVELIGGILILLGIYTKIVAVLFAIIMIGAIFFVKWNMGFFNFEVDFVLLLNAIALAIAGSGKYAVYKKSCRCENPTPVSASVTASPSTPVGSI